MLSEYTGPNLGQVAITGNIFSGMTFSEFMFQSNECAVLTAKMFVVVSSDPKSKTGLQDKHELMKQYKSHLFWRF
jgi:hypothetical protein